jgi:hypothetical protein
MQESEKIPNQPKSHPSFPYDSVFRANRTGRIRLPLPIITKQKHNRIIEGQNHGGIRENPQPTKIPSLFLL